MKRSTTLIAVAATAAAAAPAQAQVPQPTLALDRGCYAEEQEMRLTGAGYTPGGQVDLVFATTVPRGGYTTDADAAGALNDVVTVGSADQLLDPHEDRETIFLSANDRARIDADQQPPESQFGFTQFTFTRWAGFSPGRYRPAGERPWRSTAGRSQPARSAGSCSARGPVPSPPSRSAAGRRVRRPGREDQGAAAPQAGCLPRRAHHRSRAPRTVHLAQGARHGPAVGRLHNVAP